MVHPQPLQSEEYTFAFVPAEQSVECFYILKDHKELSCSASYSLVNLDILLFYTIAWSLVESCLDNSKTISEDFRLLNVTPLTVRHCLVNVLSQAAVKHDVGPHCQTRRRFRSPTSPCPPLASFPEGQTAEKAQVVQSTNAYNLLVSEYICFFVIDSQSKLNQCPIPFPPCLLCR